MLFRSNKEKKLFTSYPGIIIYFGQKIDSGKKDALISLLQYNQIHYYILHNHEFDFSIAEIVWKLENKYKGNKTDLIKNEEKNNEMISLAEIPENILFFSGFSREKVEEFLAILRSDKYPTFPLKAVATKNNQNFNFMKLINELREDRIVISHVIRLRNQIKEAENFIENDSILNKKALVKELKNEINQSELLLEEIENSFNLEEFKSQIYNLQNLLEKIH